MHSAPHNRKVAILLDFYAAVSSADACEQSPNSDDVELECGEHTMPMDVVIRKNQSKIVEFEWDVHQIIEMVKECRNEKLNRGQRFYIVPPFFSKETPICEVSIYIAKVAALCDGTRTVSETVESLNDIIKVTPKSESEKIYMALIEEARAEEVIVIQRKIPSIEHGNILNSPGQS